MRKHFSIKNLSSRIVLIAIIFVGLLFFTNDFTLVDVEKTAIVVAIGIDKEEDNFLTSAQIITPSKKDSSATNSQVVIQSKGKTVSEAINSIHSMTGWYPKLNFCNLIVIGESVLSTDIITPLNFFFRSEHFNDSAMVIGASGHAAALLQKTTPLDKLSSSSLQKIIDKSNTQINDVVSVNLKDIMKTYFSKGNSFLLPFASTQKLQAENEEGQEKQEEVVYEMRKSAVIKEDKMVALLDERMTRAYTIIVDKKSKAFFSASNIPLQTPIEINIEQKKVKQSCDIVNEQVLYTVGLKVKVSYLDTAENKKNLSDLSNNFRITDADKETIEQSIYQDIRNLFSISVENGADIFNLSTLLYKFKNQKFHDHEKILNNPDIFLSNAKIQINISVDCI